MKPVYEGSCLLLEVNFSLKLYRRIGQVEILTVYLHLFWQASVLGSSRLN